MFCVQFQKLLLKQMLQFQLVLEYKCCRDNAFFPSPELLWLYFVYFSDTVRICALRHSNATNNAQTSDL